MKKLILLLLGMFLYENNLFSHRYICNGILADGHERQDECGICNDETAARWEDPKISLVVDFDERPPQISKEDWQNVLKTSLNAWNSVDGSSLKFSILSENSNRDFGANDDVHEIFWITDKEEWRKLVGAGEFGTLGATLPRYICGGELGEKRKIFDADLVLNGLPHINWQVDCAPDEDCISVQTTLVHELGHFFGLDHPCLMCDESVMTAIAVSDIKYPLFDDVQGLRILYPNGEDGGVGFACDRRNSCEANLKCIKDGKDNYCSIPCQSKEDCNEGYECSKIGKKSYCTFIKTPTELRIEGENCSKAPCEDDLICVGPGRNQYYCFLPCNNNFDCGLKKSCIAVGRDISICMQLRYKGQKCNPKNLCEEGLMCVYEDNQNAYCRSKCKKNKRGHGICGKNETCQILENKEVCMPDDFGITLSTPSEEFSIPVAGGPNESKYKKSPLISGCSQHYSDHRSLFLLIFLLAVIRKIKLGHFFL